MTADAHANDDAWTAPRRLRAVGTAALVALILLIASIARLVAFDDAVWRAALLVRSCHTDVLVGRSVTFATRALAILVVAAVVLHVRAAGVRSAWPWAGTWLLGLATSKTLKHLLTRERPSSLPDVAVGYSFPSAHVMNGLLAMCAVMALAHGFRHRRRWYLSAGVLTATLAIGRILLAHHWASDVLGGVASALALVGFAAPALARRPVLAPTLLATLLAVVFVLDRSVGKGGWHLPTPLIGRRTALVDIDVGPETGPALRGAWTAAGPEPPFDSFQWLDGEGSVAFDVADDAVGSATTLRVAFAGRPQKRPRSCATLDVVLNGQRLARFVPFVGWREYRLPLPRALVHVGRNELAISAADETGPARFGLTYVRLAPSAAE